MCLVGHTFDFFLMLRIHTSVLSLTRPINEEFSIVMVVLTTWNHSNCQFRIMLIKSLCLEPKSFAKLSEMSSQASKGRSN